ncbi:MAG: hypothetical protein IKN96_00860 [Oscillibacter sp.]|nr:hypothetical protein [Oscillibacter sp.]
MGNDNKARLDDIRRRFAEVGVEAISPRETLELLLAYASPRGDNYAMSQALLRKYGSLKSLFSATVSQLRYAGGLSEYHAVFLSLVGQVGRQIFLEDMELRPDAFAETAHVGRYFLELVRGQPRQTFYELCLNGGDFLACYPLADGGALSEEMEARGEIIRRAAEGALESAANAVVLCRRLSGGLSAPSASDRVMVAQVRAALDTLRVNFRDYFLVADDDFVSLRETGVM